MKNKLIDIVKRADFIKEFKGEEFEVKFSIRDCETPKMPILAKILQSIDQDRYLSCHIPRGDRLLADVKFYFMDNTEYSFFRYKGAKLLKIKNHIIKHGKPFDYFRNLERLVIDAKDYSQLLKYQKRFEKHDFSLMNLEEFSIPEKYMIGNMQKDRIKDFVIDILDNRLYAVAITTCKSNNTTQKQLEIEYSGYVARIKEPKNSRFKKNDDKQIVQRLQDLSQNIYSNSVIRLSPTTETKQDFVRANV